jgi:hypothetical protein
VRKFVDPRAFPRGPEAYHGIIPSTNYLDTKNMSINGIKTLEKIDEIIEHSHPTQVKKSKVQPRDSHDVNILFCRTFVGESFEA